MRRSLFLALCFLAALPATAQWNEDGKPLPDTPARKSKDGFGAMLLLTDEPHEFMADWESPPEHRPEMKTTDRVVRNKLVVAFVVFSGCRASNGACQSSVDFSVYRPDGSLYAEHKNGELWRGQPPPPTHVQLSVANLGLTIEPDDPLGVYTIKAKVRDDVANTILELSTSLEAVAQ